MCGDAMTLEAFLARRSALEHEGRRLRTLVLPPEAASALASEHRGKPVALRGNGQGYNIEDVQLWSDETMHPDEVYEATEKR